MKFGKYIFESFKEFQEIKNEAIKVGAITAEQFFNFLSANYSNKLVKTNKEVKRVGKYFIYSLKNKI